MLEQFIGAQTSRCSCERQRLLFIWCAGASTSPLQLLAYEGGGLLPLKGFVVYIQPYGVTLSSVLTAKHDSTANFWPEIKPQQNDRRQTSSLRGYYQTGAARTLDEGNKVIFFLLLLTLYDYEKWFFALFCFISLHYNIYSLRTLQRHAELQ